MPEPIAVAFVEVLPETAAFRRTTEAQLRSQLAGTTFAVPAASTAAAAKSLSNLTAVEAEAASAATLLATAQEKYDAALVAGESLHGRAAKAHLQKAAAAEADATAQRALFAITEETSAATVEEIDALVAATGALRRKAAAEEIAAFATETHATASGHASEAILAETATMTGLRGASLGVNPAFLAATAGAIVFFKSLEAAGEFEEEMHQIEFATHATEVQLRAAARQAEAFGHDLNIPGASAVDAARAIRELTESGKSLNEAYAATPAVLTLATAADLELADSVRTTIQLLDAYKLGADEANEVTDSIAIAGKSAAGSNEEFASSLRAVAPVATAFGLSIRDTNALLIQMVQGGVSASNAGSLLRTSLLKLSVVTPAARKQLAGLNPALRDLDNILFDANKNIRPDAFARLSEALAGLDNAQKRQALSLIFSRRAVLAILPLIAQERTGWERAAETAREHGVALDEAREKEKGLRGQTKELKDDLTDLGTEFGALAVGPVTVFVKSLRDIARGANDAVFGLTAIAGAGKDLATAVPGGEKFLGLIVKAEKLQLGGAPALIGRGISSIVGHFRRGAEESAPILANMAKNVKKAFDEMAQTVEDAAERIEKGTRHVTLSLEAQLAVAQATGTAQEQLAILRERQAKQQADLARKRRRFEEGRVNEQAVINAAAALEQTNAAIASILSAAESAAEQAASDAKQARDKILAAAEARDRAFLDAINSGLQRREARVSAAASTEALADDIKAEAALRNFLRRSIEEIRKRVREARQAGHETKALKDELQALRLQKAAVRREIERLRDEARAQREATRIESAQLDVDFASIGGTTASGDRTQASVNKEIRARQRLIAALTSAQSHTKRGTVAWKRWRNQIAEEQAAIRDLRKQREKGQAEILALQKQEFAFLQTLHGFSFNLIGNLIPGGATSGLVGGATSGDGGRTGTTSLVRPPGRQPPGAAVPRTATTGPAGLRGVTTGQGNTQIHLLRQIYVELRRQSRGLDHPEAHNQRRVGSATGDNQVQGSHGM